MNKKIILKILFITLLTIFGFESSLACSYGPPYKTVCENYAQADSVIVGEIVKVKNIDANQRVEIKVKKNYKEKTSERVILDQPLSTCDWDFSEEEGRTMLLYLSLNRKTKKYSAIALGAGGEVGRTNDDLYWLDNLPRSLKRTRISGTIENYQDEPFEFLNYLTGTKVRIFNERKSYEVTTDKNGVYEVWDLPIGKYKILPEIPSGFDLRFSMSKGEVEFKQKSVYEMDTDDFKVEIKPDACGGADYVVKKKP